MLPISACANGLRTIARWSRPVIGRRSSLRRRSRPISWVCGVFSVVVISGTPARDGLGRLRRGRARLHLLSGVLHRTDDVLVSGAAAQVALDALADLLLGGVRVVAEEVDRLHDHARRAVAALQGVVVVERLL